MEKHMIDHRHASRGNVRPVLDADESNARGTPSDPRRMLHTDRSAKHKLRLDWKGMLASLLARHGKEGVLTGKRLGERTNDRRRVVLYASFRTLRELGFGLSDPWNFKEKHAKALIAHWEQEGLAAATLQTNISILRAFSAWIGKPQMIGPSEQYMKDPARLKRKTAVQRDKSWEAAGIDVERLLIKVEHIDRHVGIQMRILHAFGARRVEAIAFRPHIRDLGHVIELIDQTKGGHRRFVPITTDYQRDVLKRAKAMVATTNGHLGRQGKSIEQEEKHFEYVMAKVGITSKDLGITSHGLRHGFLQGVWESVAGGATPVRQHAAGAHIPDPARIREAQYKTSAIAGHHRPDISTAYTGARPVGRPRKPVDPHVPKHTGAQTDLFLGGIPEPQQEPMKRLLFGLDWTAGLKKEV